MHICIRELEQLWFRLWLVACSGTGRCQNQCWRIVNSTLMINIQWNVIQNKGPSHYDDVMMGAMASQIASLTIVYSTVYSVPDQRKHESSASLAFVRGIHRWSVNSPHKWPVTRKMFPFDDIIMEQGNLFRLGHNLLTHEVLRYFTRYRLLVWITSDDHRKRIRNL